MDRPRDCHTNEITSQMEKDEYHMISHIWNLKTKTNEWSRPTDTENKLVVPWGDGEWGEARAGEGTKNFSWSKHRINKWQEYIVQHRDYSLYLVITFDGV